MQIKQGDTAFIPLQTLDGPNGSPVAPTVAPAVAEISINGQTGSIPGVLIVTQSDNNGAVMPGYYILQVPTDTLEEHDQVAVQVKATPVSSEKEFVVTFGVEGSAASATGIDSDGAGVFLSAGAVLHRVFTTTLRGAAADADVLPTVQIIRDGAVDGTLSPLVSPLITGSYVLSMTLPAGVADGVSFSAIVTATIGGDVYEESILLGVASSIESDVDEINEHTQPVC